MADGLPLFGGAQLAVDTTVVSALRSDGTAIPRAAHTAGVALEAARRRKEGRYPELVGPRARSRLVVFGVEVGGRWSGESQTFISQLARARARGEQPILRRRAEQAWRIRWGPWCLVWWHGQSLLHCWGFLGLWVRMGTPLCSTMWSVTCMRRVL